MFCPESRKPRLDTKAFLVFVSPRVSFDATELPIRSRMTEFCWPYDCDYLSLVVAILCAHALKGGGAAFVNHATL